MPPLVIPIPKGVKDEEAVALIGGGDVALTFLKLLRKSSPKQIIIYGANSVTGLILMQLLTNLTKLSIVPMTTKASQKCLNDKISEYGIRISKHMEKIPSTVVDIAGNGVTRELMEHVRSGDKVYSIAQNNLRGVQFISKPSFPNDYRTLLQLIDKKQLFIPIGEVFSIDNIKSAIDYLSSHHSRGRILLSFEK